MDAVDGVLWQMHGLGDDEYALVSRFAQGGVDVGNLQLLVLHKAVHALPYHAQALLDGLLKRATDGHHLADTFHRRPQFLVHAVELREVPARNLYHHIVKSGFKEGARGLGDRVLQIEQAIAEAQLGGDEGEWIARGLRSQR